MKKKMEKKSPLELFGKKKQTKVRYALLGSIRSEQLSANRLLQCQPQATAGGCKLQC